MKGWYQAAVDHAPPPAWFTLKRITAERVYLYRYVPPPEDNIPVSVEPFPVEYLVSMEDEIEWAVKQLHNHFYEGPLGIQAKQINGWLA